MLKVERQGLDPGESTNINGPVKLAQRDQLTIPTDIFFSWTFKVIQWGRQPLQHITPFLLSCHFLSTVLSPSILFVPKLLHGFISGMCKMNEIKREFERKTIKMRNKKREITKIQKVLKEIWYITCESTAINPETQKICFPNKTLIYQNCSTKSRKLK